MLLYMKMRKRENHVSVTDLMNYSRFLFGRLLRLLWSNFLPDSSLPCFMKNAPKLTQTFLLWLNRLLIVWYNCSANYKQTNSTDTFSLYSGRLEVMGARESSARDGDTRVEEKRVFVSFSLSPCVLSSRGPFFLAPILFTSACYTS